MKAAIDIDGTLSAYPAILAPLSHALKAAGWEVVLLTGTSCPDPGKADRRALIAGREEQVRPWGASFDRIVVCVGRNSGEVAHQKGVFCRDHGVNLFLDDSRDYCAEVRRLSPQTLTLRVCA